jgi:hypothetical protein
VFFSDIRALISLSRIQVSYDRLLLNIEDQGCIPYELTPELGRTHNGFHHKPVKKNPLDEWKSETPVLSQNLLPKLGSIYLGK